MHARLTFNSGVGFQAVNRRKMNTENVRQTLRTAHQIQLPFTSDSCLMLDYMCAL